MNKLVIISILIGIALVVIFLIVLVVIMTRDPWVGNWVGKNGPNDKTTITGSAGNYSFQNTITKEKIDLNISGNEISGYGNTGIRNGNIIIWNFGNVWTKN